MAKHIVGIDLGGANLKFADASGRCVNQVFPLWKTWKQLEDALRQRLAQFPECDAVALTMTGELADCFESPEQGVTYLIEETVKAADEKPVAVWQTSGEFVPPETAQEFPSLTGASNWTALAHWAARSIPAGQSGLLIDAGSTTVDIIPIVDGTPVPNGMTDLERLQSGELVYTGGERTPLCSLASTIIIDDMPTGIAAELFATTLDLGLILGDIPENPEQFDTADGRAATMEHSHQRVTRMICSTPEMFSEEEFIKIVKQFRSAQLNRIEAALMKVVSHLPMPPQTIIASGSADYLVHALIERSPELSESSCLTLSKMYGAELASAACAYALVELAGERHAFP